MGHRSLPTYHTRSKRVVQQESVAVFGFGPRLMGLKTQPTSPQWINSPWGSAARCPTNQNTQNKQNTKNTNTWDRANPTQSTSAKSPQIDRRKSSSSGLNYVLAVLTQINNGSDVVTVKARGRAISRAVDVAQVLTKRFATDVKVQSISINTEQVKSTMTGGMSNVSSMEIKLGK